MSAENQKMTQTNFELILRKYFNRLKQLKHCRALTIDFEIWFN